ncbi:MAG: hypothetical protein ACREMW_14995 [Gemmatimonadales bacterium]
MTWSGARCLLIALVVLAGGVDISRAVAQQPAETPEQVGERYMAAIRSGDWTGAAALMHPAALRELHELFRPILEAPEGADFRRTVLGVDDAQAAAAVSDTLVFVSLMRVVVSQESGLGDVLRTATARVLGTVHEGPDTAHVVARMSLSFQGATTSIMEVSSFRRWGNTWRGILKGELTAMAAALRRSLEQGRRVPQEQ